MPQRNFERPAAGVFFDTDLSTIDTALTLGLLHGLQNKMECRVAVVSLSRPNLALAGYADAVERTYRGPAGNFSEVPPIGMITTGAAGETSPAFTVPFQKKKPDGSPVYKNLVASVIDTGDPCTLFRNYLQAQHDQNSFVMLAGPATNLAAALAFPGMKDWIVSKVKYLVVAGGAFPEGAPEKHIAADIPAARKLFAEWPTPIVACGSEIGASLEFPGASIDKEFAAAVPDSLIADAYRAYQPMPYNAPSLALAGALYAVRPNAGYFKVSAPGAIRILDDGRTTFAAAEKGRHRYLVADPEQHDKILQAYVELASAKPVGRQRFRPPDANDPTEPKPVPPKK